MTDAADGQDETRGRQWVCATCAVEQAPGPTHPSRCAVCDDERQWVPRTGQEWTTVGELRAAGHAVDITEIEPDVYGLTTRPGVGIAQTALLVLTASGNVLFDVPGLIDDAAVARVRELGGIAAIIASHPHMYGVQLQWSAAFGDAPVYVARRDRAFLCREGPAIVEWDDPFEPVPGVTALQVGGHFPGSTVLHWPAGAEGRGVLFAADAAFPSPDGRWVAFMRSYPNFVPLSEAGVRKVTAALAPLAYDRLYNNFARSVPADAPAVVERSAERHIAWISGHHDDLI